jgi:hypothetical protein
VVARIGLIGQVFDLPASRGDPGWVSGGDWLAIRDLPLSRILLVATEILEKVSDHNG